MKKKEGNCWVEIQVITECPNCLHQDVLFYGKMTWPILPSKATCSGCGAFYDIQDPLETNDIRGVDFSGKEIT